MVARDKGTSVLRWVAGAALLITGVVSTLWWQSEVSVEQQRNAKGDARRLLRAARHWKEQRMNGCPSVSRLIVDDYWKAKNSAGEGMSTYYRISCDVDTVRVHSAGADREFKTEDDFILDANWRS